MADQNAVRRLASGKQDFRTRTHHARAASMHGATALAVHFAAAASKCTTPPSPENALSTLAVGSAWAVPAASATASRTRSRSHARPRPGSTRLAAGGLRDSAGLGPPVRDPPSGREARRAKPRRCNRGGTGRGRREWGGNQRKQTEAEVSNSAVARARC